MKLEGYGNTPVYTLHRDNPDEELDILTGRAVVVTPISGGLEITDINSPARVDRVSILGVDHDEIVGGIEIKRGWTPRIPILAAPFDRLFNSAVKRGIKQVVNELDHLTEPPIKPGSESNSSSI